MPSVIQLLLLCPLPLALLLLRFLLLLRSIRSRRRAIIAHPSPPSPVLPFPPDHTLLVVLGSGGHTAEMLTLLSDFVHSQNCPHLSFAVADTDNHSRRKATQVYRALRPSHLPRFHVIPRAREVSQPPLSSLLSTARTFATALHLLWNLRPSLILCNGPANAAVVAAAAFLLRLLGILYCRVIYVESFARVLSLSLSGTLLLPFVDRFIVQWPQLRHKHQLAEYYGRLC